MTNQQVPHKKTKAPSRRPYHKWYGSSFEQYYDTVPANEKNVKGQGPHFMILFYEGNYQKKKPDSKVTCLGIYQTLNAARFVSIVIQRKEKLNFFPIIRRTTAELYPETSWKVDEYLKQQELRMQRQLVHTQKKLRDTRKSDKTDHSANQTEPESPKT